MPSTSTPPIGIRAVAHDDRDAVPARRPHAVGHRVHVGVDARADVLQVDDQRVDDRAACPASARGCRCRARTPGRGGRRRRARRAGSRSCCPARRTETRAAARTARRPRRGGPRAADRRCGGASVDRGRIGDEADTTAAQAAGGEQLGRSETDRHARIMAASPSKCAARPRYPVVLLLALPTAGQRPRPSSGSAQAPDRVGTRGLTD